MSRYAQAEVDESIVQVGRGVFTPHAQIVLAAEVEALRERYEAASALLKTAAGLAASRLATLARVETLPAKCRESPHYDRETQDKCACQIENALKPSAVEPVP